MKALLDTHALLWWIGRDPMLSPAAFAYIGASENQIFVSTASVWEISIKTKSGKLAKGQFVLDHLPHILEEQRFEILPMLFAHAARAGTLPERHKDPFDRMLIAQAQAEDLAIISTDDVFDRYGVQRIW